MLNRLQSSIRPVFFIVALFTASSAEGQTGVHGYYGGGVGVADCFSTCPPIDRGAGQVGFYGGGVAYPLLKGRVWIAGDGNLPVSSENGEASFGVSGVVALGPREGERFEPFVQGGPRLGDGGRGWNIGAGANVWMHTRFGVRLEYQYQWVNTTFSNQEFGPSGPVGPPVLSEERLQEHLVRVGIVIR
ncbi:MAG TPA: hypothetical protein VGF24_35310 [Vicinamibacterales bacterium]|jgi:hypothetical protein